MAMVSAHAVERYRERIEAVSESEARAAMMRAARAIDIAASFGAGTVVMGNGARLILVGDVVVTVKPKRFDWRPHVGALPQTDEGKDDLDG